MRARWLLTLLIGMTSLAARSEDFAFPAGFRSQWHCTVTPQYVFILGGRMQINLQDGSSRTFGPGEHFHSADKLPEGATFDPALHGHWSAQVGDEPLVTLFVRS